MLPVHLSCPRRCDEVNRKNGICVASYLFFLQECLDNTSLLTWHFSIGQSS
jgi:hypothetical protein